MYLINQTGEDFNTYIRKHH